MQNIYSVYQMVIASRKRKNSSLLGWCLGKISLRRYVWVLVTQSCPTLGNPIDCSPPGSSVHGILQARKLEWVVIPFSRGSSEPGIKPRSPALREDSLLLSHQGSPHWEGKTYLKTLRWFCQSFYFHKLEETYICHWEYEFIELKYTNLIISEQLYIY